MLGVAAPANLDVYSRTAERIGTPATIVTGVRTICALGLGVAAAYVGDLRLLVASLIVYWVGDSLDGLVARWTDTETRLGAALDIHCDRLCAAVFYAGLAYLEPEVALPALLYLANFIVIDCWLSLTFLAWPIRSPNYFYMVDKLIWQLNWSHPGKAVNSALFAVILLTTRSVWLGLAILLVLVAVKIFSVARILRIGIPIPDQVGLNR